MTTSSTNGSGHTPPRRPARRSRRVRGLAVTTAAGLLLGAGLSACDTPRSVAAVCHVWNADAVALHNRYQRDADNAQGGGLASVGDLLSAPGDIAHLMGEMADVAPDGIESDFESLQQAFQSISDSEGQAASDPLGAIGSGLVNAFRAEGSYERVSTFLETNCGAPGQSTSQ